MPDKTSKSKRAAATNWLSDQVKLELSAALADTLRSVTDPAKVLKINTAIAQLADLTAQALLAGLGLVQPDRIKRDAAHCVSTIASLAALEAAEIRQRWQEAAWAVAQRAAHALVALTI